MNKISLLSIGGLGIEKKVIRSSDNKKKIKSLGGSSWHIAISGKALGCESTILSLLGSDSKGKYVLSILEKNNIHFKGIFHKKTQEYCSVIVNGTPTLFSALTENINIEQIKSCFDSSTQIYDIIIIGYLDFRAIPYFLSQKSTGKIIVLNMSDSILNIPSDKIFEYLSMADIVTLNRYELDELLNRTKVNELSFFEKISSKDNLICVTSHSFITYIVNTKVKHYQFKKLDIAIDSTGAGDAFATSVAVGKHYGWPIERILAQAVFSAHSMCKLENKDSITDSEWLLYK